MLLAQMYQLKFEFITTEIQFKVKLFGDKQCHSIGCSDMPNQVSSDNKNEVGTHRNANTYYFPAKRPKFKKK